MKGIFQELKYFRDFVAFLSPYKAKVFYAVFFLFVGTVAESALPVVIKYAVDFLKDEQSYGMLFFFFSVFIAVSAVSAFADFQLIYTTNLVGQSVLKDIRDKLFKKFLSVKPELHAKLTPSRAVVRVTSDIENMNELFVSGIVIFIADIVLILGIFVAMFFINAKLALVVLAIFPLIVFSTLFFRKRISVVYGKLRGQLSELNFAFTETFKNLPVVRVFSREGWFRKRFTERNERYSRENRKSVFLFSFFFSSILFVSVLTISAVLFFGGLDIMRGEISLGTLIAFWYAVEKLFDPIWDFSDKYNIFQSAVSSAKRIFEIFQQEDEKGSFHKSVHVLCKKHAPHILFSRVWFSYGDGWVLKDVSFSVERGQKVAIVGRTGSGKTTLAKLCMAFYIPQKGKIFIAGRDTALYHPSWIRQLISWVPQENTLFDGTVLWNIAPDGKISQTVSKIIEEIKHVLPPLDTVLVEGGKNISVGQKQLICLLRAINFEREIYIFDEFTSSLDFFTESEILRIIRKYLERKTVIVITHRIFEDLRFDKVLKVEDGKVTEV